MMRQLNLIRNETGKQEKRIFPRFPFCYLVFKISGDENKSHQVFEVKDISQTGMQLALREGEHQCQEGEKLQGELHWNGDKLALKGEVQWKTSSRLGVKFSSQEGVKEFLNHSRLAKNIRPINRDTCDLEIPARLKYWLRADGPVEIFVWQHGEGQFSVFQIIVMENFVEWENGVGLKTGRVLSKRDIDSPLLTEDEFVFLIDSTNDKAKIQQAKKLLEVLPMDFLDVETGEFLQIKLEVT